VRIIVPTAASGPDDILTRLIGQWLSEHLSQPVIVENRPGAGTNTATEVVVRAPPDGYTLFSAGPASAINATLYDKLSFNFLRDTAPVAGVMPVSNVLVVHPSFPARTVPEFIVYTKANPGKLSMASGGIGSGSHMADELFKMMAGVDMFARALSRQWISGNNRAISGISRAGVRAVSLTGARGAPGMCPVGDFDPPQSERLAPMYSSTIGPRSAMHQDQ